MIAIKFRTVVLSIIVGGEGGDVRDGKVGVRSECYETYDAVSLA